MPSVSSTYDVELVLDGVVDAFTCIKTEDGWSVGDSTEGVLSFGCDGFGFRLDATPETVGISVAAQDGSWTGSIKLDGLHKREPGLPVLSTQRG